MGTSSKISHLFNGFVFYMPLDKHRYIVGIPGIIDSAFCKELKRRFEIVGKVSGENVSLEDSVIWKWNRAEEDNDVYNDSIRSEIFKWLK